MGSPGNIAVRFYFKEPNAHTINSALGPYAEIDFLEEPLALQDWMLAASRVVIIKKTRIGQFRKTLSWTVPPYGTANYDGDTLYIQADTYLAAWHMLRAIVDNPNAVDRILTADHYMREGA